MAGQWKRKRECRKCGAAYRLADHGVAGAKAIAQSLEAGHLAEDDAPAVAWTCPECLGTGRTDENEARAAMFRLEHAADRARKRQIPKDVKTAASGLVVLGGMWGVAFWVFGLWRGFSTVIYGGIAAGIVMVLGGLGIGIGAALRAKGRRKPSV